MKSIISIVATVCCMAVVAETRPLVDLAADVEKAKQDINAAIQAMGGEGSGGLTNASKRILAIPLPSGDYEQTYIAWSNATRMVRYPVTNEVYQLVEWLQGTKTINQYIDLGVKANQDTYVEIGVSNVSDTTWSNLFGDTSDWGSTRYCLTIYQDKTSAGYANTWYEPAKSTIPSKDHLFTFKMDGNLLYVDGELVNTMTKPTFTTKYTLYALNRRCDELSDSSKAFAGKLLWIDLKRAVTSSGSEIAPDMVLRPSIDPNGTPCLLDIAAYPVNAYYCNSPIQAGPVTNTLYDISWIEFEAICPEPYETNIVGNAENKLIEDDAIRYMYQKMSPAE